MRHIRFLQAQQTVCQRPDLLGSQLVTLDSGNNANTLSMCKECDRLLWVHNQRETYNEARELMETIKPHALKHYGAWLVGFTSIFWITCFLTWYLLFMDGS